MLDFSDILSLFHLCRNLMIAEMPSEKRIFMKEKYFLNRHAVLGTVVGLLLMAIVFVIAVGLVFCYACVLVVPPALIAGRIANKFLFALAFSPLFVMMFIITAPVSFFVKNGFEKIFKAILIKMYGPNEDDKDEIW